MKTLIVRLKKTSDISSKKDFPRGVNGNISFITQLSCGYNNVHGFFAPSIQDCSQSQIQGALLADEVSDVDIYYLGVSDEFYSKIHNARNFPAEKDTMVCYRGYLHASKFRRFEFELSPDEFTLRAKTEYRLQEDSMHTIFYVDIPTGRLDKIKFYESLNYDSQFLPKHKVSQSVDLTQLDIESTELAAAYYSVTNVLMN
jgi:hypothetical protein